MLVEHFGAELTIFDLMKMPIIGSVSKTHSKVVELRELCL